MEVVGFRCECALLCPDPILGYSTTRVCQSLLCGLLLNALFGSICIKYIHIVCVQTNTEVFPSVSYHNYNKILKSDWLSTALVSAYVSCLNNSRVRAIRRALKWKLSCFDHNYNKFLKSDWLSTALISAYVSCLKRAITRALKWNFSCFDFKKRALYITNFVKVTINWEQNFVSSNSVCNNTCD